MRNVLVNLINVSLTKPKYYSNELLINNERFYRLKIHTYSGIKLINNNNGRQVASKGYPCQVRPKRRKSSHYSSKPTKASIEAIYAAHTYTIRLTNVLEIIGTVEHYVASRWSTVFSSASSLQRL